MYIRINRNSIGQFKRRRETLAFVSVDIGYKPNPKFNPQLPEDSFNKRELPYMMTPRTYNAGRNKAKRAAKAAYAKAMCGVDSYK